MEELLQEMVNSIRAEARVNDHQEGCECYKCGWASRAEVEIVLENIDKQMKGTS